MDTERNPTMFGGNRFQPAAGRRRPAMALGRAAVHPDERRLFRGGSRWVLNPCPWNSDHTSRAAFIVQFPNGALAAGCHHNGCAGKDWHTLRDLVEPGWRDSQPNSDSGEEPAGHTKVPLPATAHHTDLGNAKRLVKEHGEDLRYCPAWGRWLVWNGQRWVHDSKLEVMRRAKATVLGMYTEAAGITNNDDLRGTLVQHARRSENAARLEAMVKLAASELGIVVSPAQLDA